MIQAPIAFRGEGVESFEYSVLPTTNHSQSTINFEQNPG